VGGSLITHGVPAFHHIIESATQVVATIPVLSGLMVAITPLLIDLLVGFVLGALLVFMSLAVSSLKKKKSMG